MLEFRLLGPVEILRDGEPVRFPRQAPTRMLAALLLQPGWAVSTSTLVDALWPDDPPQTARRQIQNTAALIRRRLDCGNLLTHTAGSYTINVDTDQCDAERFKESVALAKDARANGELATALAYLRDGLALWRGQALADLTGQYFESAAHSLDEARLVAIEDLIDLETRVERDYERVVNELQRLCADHPHRSRIVGQLMTALYRLGRTPDALDAYQRFQERLADDLGIDPPHEIRELHTAILRDEVRLQEAPQRPEAPHRDTAPRPAQLPSAPRTFTGRDGELRRLTEIMSEPASRHLVAITGLAGSGKTALALEWAHRERERFPDGHLYVDLRGADASAPMPPGRALTHVLRSLSVTAVPDSIDEAVAMYRSMTADRRLLVVLDNAADAAQVRPLLPGAGGSATLVTSRNRLSGLTVREDAALLRLEPLTTTESLDLLGAMLGTECVAAEPEAAEQMCEQCGHLPLALRIATSRLLDAEGVGIADLCEELGADRLSALEIEDDPLAAVRSAFDGSLRRLDAMTLNFLMKLGLLPGSGFPHELAAEIADTDLRGAVSTIRRVENASLLEPDGAGRSRFHDLVKTYVDELARGELKQEVQESVHDRYTDWYYSRTGTMKALEFDNVLAAVRRWAGHRRAVRLARPLSMFAPLAFSTKCVRNEVEAALPAEAEVEAASMRYELHSTRFQVLWSAGEYTDALHHARLAAAAAEKVSDTEAAAAYGDMAVALYGFGRYREAMEFGEKAVAIGRTVNAARLGGDLGCVAHLARAMGNHGRAEALVNEAIEIAEAAGNRVDVMDCRLTAALLDLDLCHWEAVEATLDEVERFANEENAVRFKILAARMRGEMLRMRGRYSQSLTLLEQALADAEATQRTGMARRVRIFLAETLAESGRSDEAMTHLRKTFQNDEGRLRPTEEARRALVLCKIHTQAGHQAEAIEEGQKAVTLYESMPDRLWRHRSESALTAARRSGGLADILGVKVVQEG
ncbi:AfsR/SARP family transcriptional regulator [Glycomyces xiaoerkulensis]|uniref:AfsR/SARP family transcriptional regulator n=1 Tax=Glycomyces xiaoerkulensis TaxID=2038139 RepID=UPI000C26368A|nr:BTAD domain-containing putative transcriptional regulator [Glycomyces xiaoerkulensis]